MAKASEFSEIEYEYSKIITPKPVAAKNRIDIKEAITVCLICAMSLIAVGLMIKGLLVRIELAEQSDVNVGLKQELDSLQEDNRSLRIEYESKIDLDEIEDYAKNVLGMQKPGQSRIKKINTDTQDKAIVLGNSGEADIVD